MRKVCAGFETRLAEVNGEASHLHLLVSFPPKVALPKLVNSPKDASSRRMLQEFPDLAATTGGRTGYGPGRTSPDRPAALPSLSSSKTGPPDPGQGPPALTTGLKTGALSDILVAAPFLGWGA